MIIRVFTTVSLLTLLSAGHFAQAQSKADRKMLMQVKNDITYLASEELEGRRTGTRGEGIAAEYIIKRYMAEGIRSYKREYLYPFHFVYGKEISGATVIRINGTLMHMEDEAFPLPFSPTKHVNGDIVPGVTEQGNIWMVPLFKDQDQANDAHFESEKYMYDQTKELEKQGATGVIFYDSYGGKWAPAYNKQSIYETVGIPVAYLSNKAYQKYIAGANNKGGIPIDLNITINRTERTGNNIAAFIDNGAKYTVIIGAHYDHLGYGEDGNSLMSNVKKEHLVHHGADDNASGTAAVLQVAAWVKQHPKKTSHFNYMFLNFSGEELGLFGSKAFVKDQGIDSAHVAYMINLDMVGRLNDSTHALELGGVGTSPSWAEVPGMAGSDFKLSLDSSGIGPSDHSSFYSVGIPVLFLFTGQHKDYHKPSDIAERINYAGEGQIIKFVDEIVAAMDKEKVKPRYLVTKQKSTGKTSFRVTLGIMPDYSYQDGGVRVDGVSDDRPAARAGIKQGDIIIQLGDIKVNGMQSYMEALGKFAPGDKTKVTVKRDGKEVTMPVEMAGK